MTSTTDPNQVRLTGENSFIRLAAEQDGEQTTNASHWRVLLSPAGPRSVPEERPYRRGTARLLRQYRVGQVAPRGDRRLHAPGLQ